MESSSASTDIQNSTSENTIDIPERYSPEPSTECANDCINFDTQMASKSLRVNPTNILGGQRDLEGHLRVSAVLAPRGERNASVVPEDGHRRSLKLERRE